MLHIVLALYIFCFAGGITVIFFGFFASTRFGSSSFRHFAVLFISATMMLVVEALKTYEKAVGVDFGLGLHVFASVFSACANVMMGYFIPWVAFEIVGRVQSPPRWRVHIAVAAFLGVVGGLKELAAPFILWNVNYLLLLGMHAYGATILVKGYRGIGHPWMKSLIRSFLVFLAVFAPLAIVQLVLQDIPSSPPVVHDYPLEQILYYIGFVVLIIVYAARYLFAPPRLQASELPEEFVNRFSISHREREIISMVVQGYSNRTIGERLFISAVTVKNHIYHIYQKTGVANKIQLLNLMNSPK